MEVTNKDCCQKYQEVGVSDKMFKSLQKDRQVETSLY